MVVLLSFRIFLVMSSSLSSLLSYLATGFGENTQLFTRTFFPLRYQLASQSLSWYPHLLFAMYMMKAAEVGPVRLASFSFDLALN
jgi:hypothetical protein